MPDTTRNGKIARLPQALRQELNGRIERGEPSECVLEWLNGQTVQAVGPGFPALGEADLADWRETGYRDWVAQAETREQARQLHAEVADLKQAGTEPLTDVLALFLTGQYVRATKAAVRQASGEPAPLPVLRTLCGDLVALRRGDHQAERLRLERERLDLAERELELQRTHKVDLGLDALIEEIRDDAAASAAFDAFRQTIGRPGKAAPQPQTQSPPDPAQSD